MSLTLHTESNHEAHFGASQHVEERRFSSADYPRGVERTGRAWTYVACPAMEATHPVLVAHHDSIVIAVKGIRNSYRAQPVIGIFVHPNSDKNHSEPLSAFQRISKVGAEVFAIIYALRMAITIREKNDVPQLGRPSPYHRLRRIVIKSDSSFVVTAMTHWIYGWRKNDYVGAWNTRHTSQNRQVRHSDLFRQLEDLVCELNIKGVRVQFWCVPEEQHIAATRLAQAAWDGHSLSNPGERLGEELPEEFFEVGGD